MDMNVRPKKSIGTLISDDHHELLNAQDLLRAAGVEIAPIIPRLIVCGAKGVGKTATLDAITGIPLLVGSNTRIQTEFLFRTANEEKLHASVIPRDKNSKEDPYALSVYSKDLDSFDDVAAAQEEAMRTHSELHGEAWDILRFNFEGPDFDNLDVIDGPGLDVWDDIDAADREDLIENYKSAIFPKYWKDLDHPQTVILMVLSAESSQSDRTIIEVAKSQDSGNRRTLGVITAPDELVRGSLAETACLRKASNAYTELRLGWHVLKNAKKDADAEASLNTYNLEDRAVQEGVFFSESPWNDLQVEQLGIAALRRRLGRILHSQACADISNVVPRAEKEIRLCQGRLDELGPTRATVDDQGEYLQKLSQEFSEVMNQGAHGVYTSTFFTATPNSQNNQKFFSRTLRNLHNDFDTALDHSVNPSGGPISDARLDQIIRDVKVNHRGAIDAYFVSPEVALDVFTEMSKSWHGLGITHISNTHQAAKVFQEQVLGFISDSSTGENLLSAVFEPKMQSILLDMRLKLEELLGRCREKDISQLDDYISRAVRLESTSRKQFVVNELIDTLIEPDSVLFRPSSTTPLRLRSPYTDEHRLRQAVEGLMEEDMEERKMYVLRKCIHYYYNDMKSRFLSEVSDSVIRDCLLAQLPKLFTAVDVSNMSNATVESLAKQSPTTIQTRKMLQARLDDLQTGLRTCSNVAPAWIREKLESNPTPKILPKHISQAPSTPMIDPYAPSHSQKALPIPIPRSSIRSHAPNPYRRYSNPSHPATSSEPEASISHPNTTTIGQSSPGGDNHRVFRRRSVVFENPERRDIAFDMTGRASRRREFPDTTNPILHRPRYPSSSPDARVSYQRNRSVEKALESLERSPPREPKWWEGPTPVMHLHTHQPGENPIEDSGGMV